MIQGADRWLLTNSAGTKVEVLGSVLADMFGNNGTGSNLTAYATGITAYAGGGQTNATQLAALWNNVTTVATAADSVKLPAAAAGLQIQIRNNGASNLAIFPATGDAINSLSANASVTLAVGADVILTAKDSTTWYTTTLGHIQGLIPVSGQTASPRVCHTGGQPAMVSTDGTNATPVVTETYISEVFIPCNMTITGISVFNGATVGTDKHVAYLCDSTGTVVANSALAGTTTSGADSYQDLALASAYAAKGPATYYVALQMNGTTDRYNAHTFGRFGASKKTSTVFGTLASITPPTTFTTALGPMATLY